MKRICIAIILIVLSSLAADSWAANTDKISTINPEIKQLPRKYFGINPATLYAKLLKDKKSLSIKKSEFETTKDYLKRTAAAETMASRYNGFYAFPLTKCVISYDADRSIISIKKPYDDEIKDEYLQKELSATVRREIGSRGTIQSDFVAGRTFLLLDTIKKKGTYVGRNAFNVTAKVERRSVVQLSLAFKDIFRGFDGTSDKYSDIDISIDMPPEKAKEARLKGLVLLIAKLTEPYTGQSIEIQRARLDDPVEIILSNYYLAIEPVELWFYNFKTGEIYQKFKLEKKYDI